MENEEPMMMEDENMMMEEESHEEGNPMMANLTFFMTALFGAISFGLNGFKYRAGEDYYAAWSSLLMDSDTTNFWMYADMISSLNTVWWGVLAITQILATFGIAVEINMMLWSYLTIAIAVTNMLANLSYFIAYDTASTDEGKSSAGPSAGLISGVFTSWLYLIAKETS